MPDFLAKYGYSQYLYTQHRILLKTMIFFFVLQVTGVVGRAECLSSIFFLAALWSFSKCTGYKLKMVYMFKCMGRHLQRYTNQINSIFNFPHLKQQGLGALRAKIDPTSDDDNIFSKICSQYVIFRNK